MNDAMTLTGTPQTAAQHPVVHVRLDGAAGGPDLVGLGRQLAACLRGGAMLISVHLGDQPDVDVTALEALDGVADYLHRRGGGLILVGVHPRVATRIAVHGLIRLDRSPLLLPRDRGPFRWSSGR